MGHSQTCRVLLGALAVVLASFVAMAAPASAITIDFDSQGLSGPSTFAAACAVTCPQAVTVGTAAGNVTFTGGVILTNTTFLPADQTSLYGTANFASGLLNPITITFQNPVTNFLVDVLNGESFDVDYTVSDNNGNSSTFTLAPNLSSGATTIGFAATGTIVNVASVTIPTSTFDFFMDNIQFDVPIVCSPTGCTSSVPEPTTLWLLGLSLAGLAVLRRLG
jgi:hypothetical protein